MWLIIDGVIEENGEAPSPLPKRKLGSSNTEGSQKMRKKTLASTNKLWLEGVYIMQNKDTNTNYQKVLRVGDQKWETVKITIGIFFCLRFVFTIFYPLAPIITQEGTTMSHYI